MVMAAVCHTVSLSPRPRFEQVEQVENKIKRGTIHLCLFLGCLLISGQTFDGIMLRRPYHASISVFLHEMFKSVQDLSIFYILL